ncbi:thiamine phosphate synthase [Lichenibacterium dinghuense]|uniref:thiamine phosphate synthase n=1 Tax=Lichenibacterium dinghuense TaxID=2895977 RepID=UPI001F3F930F|nr:thiamine phosphate synthase [Lichenibacterium sp. 6Y81]
MTLPVSGRPLPGRLLVVTDRHQAAEPLPELCGALLAAGLRWLWLRDRDLPPAERRALALDLAARAAQHGAALTVGADVALAVEVGAGVQLGAGADVAAARRRLGPGALVGVSAHSLADLRAARDAGADYATLSPVFPSRSKPGYGPALGLDGLRAAAAVGLPVLALGGITAGMAGGCLEAGAAGAAVMGDAMRGGAGFVAGWPAVR